MVKHHGSTEILKVGPIKISVLCDSVATSQRLSSVLITIPPHTPGPPPHWHEMHDETFLVTKGRMNFLVPQTSTSEAATIEEKAGDYVVVPIKVPHTFENPGDEEAEVFNTFSPSFYIDYFRILDRLTREKEAKGEKGRLEDKVLLRAMARFATLPAEVEVEPEKEGRSEDTYTRMEKQEESGVSDSVVVIEKRSLQALTGSWVSIDSMESVCT
jgi:mannose-6-phosphate isomerase-like protein (cupin superfamily)